MDGVDFWHSSYPLIHAASLCARAVHAASHGADGMSIIACHMVPMLAAITLSDMRFLLTLIPCIICHITI